MRIHTFFTYTFLIFVFVAGGAGCSTVTDKAMALHALTPCGQMMSAMMDHGGDSAHGGTALERETVDEAPAEQQEEEGKDETLSPQQGAHMHHSSPAAE